MNIKYPLSRLSFFLIALCSCSLSLMAQAKTETVTKTHFIYFNTASSSYDANYKDNARSLSSALSDIAEARRSDPDYKVILTGATSPDGTYKNNTIIAGERSDSTRILLINELRKMGIYDALSHFSSVTLEKGIDWQGLADLTDKVNEEWAPVMSDIFRNYPLFTYDSNKNVNGGKKDVAGRYLDGEPYKYLRKHVFAEVCRTKIEIISTATSVQETVPEVTEVVESVPVTVVEWEPVAAVEPEPVAAVEPEPVAAVEPEPVASVEPEPVASVEPEPVAVVEPEPAVQPETKQEEEELIIPKPEYRLKKCFAIRTNLAFDLATAVNLGFEIPFSRHFSLAVEYYKPWWITNQGRGSYCFFGDAMQIEGRLWFPRNRTSNSWAREALNGLFIGVYGGTGKYDIQDLDHGWRGEFWNAGVGLGYSANVSKRLNIEFEVGYGMFDTNYQSYTATTHDNILEVEDKCHKQMHVPTRANLTLVWNIYHKKRSK